MNTAEDFDLHRPKEGEPEQEQDKDAFKKFYEALSFLNVIERLDGVGRGMSQRFKARNSGKTRKGAKHEHGQTFKSVSLLGISPAEYRRQHLGTRRK